ncbi:Subtilisin DY [compost metagenome]
MRLRLKFLVGMSVLLTAGEVLAASPAVQDTRVALHERINLKNKSYTGHGVVVAVIDSGVDFDHPLIRENRWINKSEAQGLPGVDDDHNGFIDDIAGWNFLESSSQQQDNLGHGTASAGVISSKIGLARDAQIMDLQVTDSHGVTTWKAVVAAIKYALKRKAQIINISLSADYGLMKQIQSQIPAEQFESALFVISGGNSSRLLPDKNDIDNVLFVGATTLTEPIFRRAYYSMYGSGIDISAPAGDTLGNVTLALNWKVTPYRNYNGTSSAAPVVSGAAALKLQQSPHLKPKELKALIMSSAAKYSFLDKEILDGNVLNVDALLQSK